MTEELYKLLLGVPVAALGGYLAGDVAHGVNIGMSNDDLVLRIRQNIFAGYSSYEELIESGLPKVLKEVLEGWRSCEEYRKINNPQKYIPLAVYEASIKEIEGIWPIGPISWFYKRINLMSLRRKQRKLELSLR